LETTGKHSLAIAGLGITFATFLICAVCYLAIMAKLKSSGKELVKTTEHAIKHAAIERSVLRRITGYILIFFVKWYAHTELLCFDLCFLILNVV